MSYVYGYLGSTKMFLGLARAFPYNGDNVMDPRWEVAESIRQEHIGNGYTNVYLGSVADPYAKSRPFRF